MKTKNIVFDFGNVIMKYDVRNMLDKFQLSESEKDLFVAKIFSNPLWIDADRGYGYRDVLFFDTVKQLPEKLRKVFYALVSRYDFELRFMPLNEGIEELIIQLKQKGYGIYLLSNVGYGFHYFSSRASVFTHFDGMFASCDHGVLKPEKEIFEAFFEKFSLIPEECLFIDDTPENISAGILSGMKAIEYNALFEDVGSLRDKLDKFGI